MNRNEFIKLLPTELEGKELAEIAENEFNSPEFSHHSFFYGMNTIIEYLKAKFPDFTEDEKFAIELYNKDKLQALKYLMHETGRGLKEANDFLQQNQNP